MKQDLSREYSITLNSDNNSQKGVLASNKPNSGKPGIVQVDGFTKHVLKTIMNDYGIERDLCKKLLNQM